MFILEFIHLLSYTISRIKCDTQSLYEIKFSVAIFNTSYMVYECKLQMSRLI